jgi:hypothetical protein
MDKIEEFHEARIMFYIWDDEVIVAPEGDPRGHKEFIYDDEIYSNCVRGYYKDNDLVVYTGGDDFSTVEIGPLVASIEPIIKALKLDVSKTHLYNGVRKGKPGEVWEPKWYYLIQQVRDYGKI